eukprot:13217176-Ditylum_brightwellii.AAC.1
MICFECKDTNDDSIPSLQACMSGDSSSNEESKDDNSSIGTFLSMSSLNTKTINSSSKYEIIASSFKWEHLDEEEIKPDIEDEDEEARMDHRSDEGKGEFIFTNITHINKKVAQKGNLSKNWLLMDNQSTVSIMSNPCLVLNIRNAGKRLCMGTYTGHAYTDMICNVGGWGTTWFHPNGIANILALHEANDKWCVTYDSESDNTFKIHKPNHVVVFNESDNGLYYHDVSDRSVVVPNELAEQVVNRLRMQKKRGSYTQ